MTTLITQPPQVTWTSGLFSNGPLIRTSTRIQNLSGVFIDENARLSCDPLHIVYDVERVDSAPVPGALYTGVTHLQPGKVGEEYFMTRGHFHARREQGEVYCGLRGSGLLLLQDEQGAVSLESVFPGSVHIIPGFTAHRLINTGSDVLSALAVWPCAAGHDYDALTQGFNVRVVDEGGQMQIKEFHHD